MRFSQRKGITPVRVDIQRESMDAALRNKIWSALHIAFLSQDEFMLNRSGVDTGVVIRRLWIHFFQRPVDHAPLTWDHFVSTLRDWFYKAEWHEVYDVVEALADELEVADDYLTEYSQLVNEFLTSEMSAYRLVDRKIAEITGAEEIASIEEAIEGTSGLPGVRTHLRTALAMLTNRSNPDFRNSMKESISAVEAICKLITGDEKATLGQALKRLKDAGIHLHPSMEQAWTKLYGYTSDEGGIRHALADSPVPDSADAKYLLVTCSAFVGFLIERVGTAGVPIRGACPPA